jgi:tight adherence protein B
MDERFARDMTMRNGPLLALAAVLLLGLLLGALALVQAGSGKRLRERVRGLSQATETIVPLPSIRVGRSTHGPLRMRIFAFLRFNPDIPQEQVIAWPLTLLLSVAVACLAAWWLDGMLGRPLALVAGPIAGVLFARWLFGWQHGRYCDAVFRQIPDALGLMVRAIRAGLPLAEALRNISREMPSPTKEEFARVVGDIAIGRPVEAALVRLHERTGLTEYAFLAVTLGLQSQTGGSLAETLDNLSEMVRKRVAMAKRAKAMAGEAKAQAGMLVVMPFLAAAAMSFIQPFYIAAFTENPSGQRMAMIGLGMMLMGLLTIRWMIRQAGRD